MITSWNLRSVGVLEWQTWGVGEWGSVGSMELSSEKVLYRRPATQPEPADQLLDGRQWALTPGVDYNREQEGRFRNRIYYRARMLGRGVQIKFQDGLLYVRAYDLAPGDLTEAADAPQAP